MYRVPYCSKALYENLYASYLNSSPHVLLDAAGIADWQGKEVLDLCGGNGRLSMAACQMGAKVRMIEGDREMCDPGELAKWGIDARFGKVELMLRVYARLDCPLLFDAVFCQQAINYWLTLETARDTAANMRVGGVFVFNTFNTIPPTVPTFRELDAGDHREYEAFHFCRGTVHHVQLREGYPPHQTSFRWIPPDEFDRILVPHFDVERRTDGRTDIYVCRKRE